MFDDEKNQRDAITKQMKEIETEMYKLAQPSPHTIMIKKAGWLFKFV